MCPSQLEQPSPLKIVVLLCTRLSAVSCLFTCLLVSDNWMSGARRAEAIIIGDCATLATILAALCSWPSWHHSRDTWQHRPVVTMGVQAEAPPSQRERRSSPQVQGHQQCWIQGHQQCWVSLLYVVSRTGRFVIISQSHEHDTQSFYFPFFRLICNIVKTHAHSPSTKLEP